MWPGATQYLCTVARRLLIVASSLRVAVAQIGAYTGLALKEGTDQTPSERALDRTSRVMWGVTMTGLAGHGCPTMGSVAGTWPNSTQL